MPAPTYYPGVMATYYPGVMAMVIKSLPILHTGGGGGGWWGQITPGNLCEQKQHFWLTSVTVSGN